jgi:hypothetical protein
VDFDGIHGRLDIVQDDVGYDKARNTFDPSVELIWCIVKRELIGIAGTLLW